MNNMKTCQKCNSFRIISVCGKCSDLSSVEFRETEEDGYLPHDLGIGGGDYIEFSYCLECGQIQGAFPLPESEIEREENEREEAQQIEETANASFDINNYVF
jgi:hypothetical protein